MGVAVGDFSLVGSAMGSYEPPTRSPAWPLGEVPKVLAVKTLGQMAGTYRRSLRVPSMTVQHVLGALPVLAMHLNSAAGSLDFRLGRACLNCSLVQHATPFPCKGATINTGFNSPFWSLRVFGLSVVFPAAFSSSSWILKCLGTWL